MIHKKIKSYLVSTLKDRVLSRSPYTYYYDNNNEKNWEGAVETYFKSSDGREIPVFENHRYSLKKCWSVYGPLAALSELKNKGLLSDGSIAFFKKAIGNRTITLPFDEIREHLKPYLEKHRDLFISTNIPDIGKRLMIPSVEATKALIERKTAEHTALINKINATVSKKIKPGDKALEIGYTSGGESVIAFEKCGLQAIGIDNYYHNAVEATNRHEIVIKNVPNKTNFLVGDVTEKTEIEESSIDLIYSLSVIEHITDLEACFKELYRILKPGAVMFHRYDPYFHILGGHSHSTLDAPWAHMRLNDDDVQRYITELRPHEAPITLPWIKNALNRNHSQSNILKLLTQAGFKISIWQNNALTPERQTLLTGDIINDCIRTNIDKNLSISDLNSSAVSILAEKPA